jgi:hypothetical protein
VVVGVVVAALSYMGAGKLYSGIGKTGGLTIDGPEPTPGPHAGSATAKAEADAEIRQMVEAKNVRRVARGAAPIDVDEEVAALVRPAGGHDEALREEVRQLVVARNERRARAGKAPLDVEEEIDRELRELGR